MNPEAPRSTPISAILQKLQAWRDADHADVMDLRQLLNRNEVVVLIEGVARLRSVNADLLDACQVALGHLTGGLDGDYRDCDPREILRAAIAKARGEQPSGSKT